MIINIPKLNIHIQYIMYLVEAYLSYNDYLEGDDTIKFVFSSRGEYKRKREEYVFFGNLYVVSEGEVTCIDYIDDNTTVDVYDVTDNDDY